MVTSYMLHAVCCMLYAGMLYAVMHHAEQRSPCWRHVKSTAQRSAKPRPNLAQIQRPKLVARKAS
jgi:hypothetical protein